MDINSITQLILALAALVTAIAGLVAALRGWHNIQQNRRRKKIEDELDKERQNVAPIPVVGQIVWSAPPTKPTDLPYAKKKKVITIGNFKGGVGKTTLSSNLAAYYGTHGSRVLLIDFDYQGSLSFCCARMIGARRNTYSAARLLDHAPNTRALKELALPLDNEQNPSRSLPKVDLFTAFYPLDIQETQQLIDWKNDPTNDVRYRLRDVLASPDFSEYDVVIIDAPPRFSTGTINALCASTHLLIPTILDLLSSEAVTYFATQLQELKPTVFPHLNVVGVVPTMIHPGRGELTSREDRVAERINAEMRRLLGADSWVLKDAAVPRLAAIMNVAGEGIASVMNDEVKELFESIGPKITRRLT